MKCRAALWFSMPGAVPYTQTYPSMKAVLEDMERMVEDWLRFGGAEPVGVIYAYDSDTELYNLKVSRNGVIRRTPA